MANDEMPNSLFKLGRVMKANHKRNTAWIAVTSTLICWAITSDALLADPPAAKLKVAGLSQFIDEAILRTLQKEEIPVSPVASDAEILRRVYLDLVGVIPSASVVPPPLVREPNILIGGAAPQMAVNPIDPDDIVLVGANGESVSIQYSKDGGQLGKCRQCLSRRPVW